MSPRTLAHEQPEDRMHPGKGTSQYEHPEKSMLFSWRKLGIWAVRTKVCADRGRRLPEG